MSLKFRFGTNQIDDMDVVMLASAFNPVLLLRIEDFLRVKPVRSVNNLHGRAEYQKARLAFLTYVLNSERPRKANDLGKFFRAIRVLQKAPDIYKARYTYMTSYQILRLAGQAGTADSKILIKAFANISKWHSKPLLEIEQFLNSISSRRVYTRADFKVVEMTYC